MTANGPQPVGASARPSGGVRDPDPWGVRRAEVLLTSLKGILSARVVVTPTGEISEIHVLTESGLTAKQVVRNVESALLAQLGIKVDHRKISVAQTAEVLPLEVMDAQAAHPVVHRRDILFQRLEVVSEGGHKVRIQVALDCGGEEYVREEIAADTGPQRLAAAARAATAALDDIVADATVDLAGVKIVDAFETEYAFVGVNILTGRDTLLHTGTCEIKRGTEQAAALAVLDATNRWLRSKM